MSKKQQANPQPKAKESQHPAVEDFFTQFIEKRKKYFTQKLEEIALLEKSDFASLKPDQKEKINNKAQTSEKVKYFDDIKQLYFEAVAKKGPVSTEVPSKTQDSKDVLISDFVNLFSVGQAFHNFEKNSKHIEHVFNSDQMTLIQDLYNSLNKQHSPEQIEESKLKLKSYAENEALRASVQQFLSSYKTSHEHVEAHKPYVEHHTHQEETAKHHIQPVSKPKLFDYDSEEEEEQVHHKKEQTSSGQKGPSGHVGHEEVNAVSSNLLKPLPEGDDRKVDEFKNHNKRNNYNNNRSGPNRPPREYQDRPQYRKNYEGDKAPEGHKAPEGNKGPEGEQRAPESRPPRPYNPNYVRREGEFRPHNKEGRVEREGEFKPHNKEGRVEREGEFRPHNKGNFERRPEGYRGNQDQFSGQYRERREQTHGERMNSGQPGQQRNHQKEEQKIQN